jgi:hypothetical protein
MLLLKPDSNQRVPAWRKQKISASSACHRAGGQVQGILLLFFPCARVAKLKKLKLKTRE